MKRNLSSKQFGCRCGKKPCRCYGGGWVMPYAVVTPIDATDTAGQGTVGGGDVGGGDGGGAAGGGSV
jgi:hypothetical protein